MSGSFRPITSRWMKDENENVFGTTATPHYTQLRVTDGHLSAQVEKPDPALSGVTAVPWVPLSPPHQPTSPGHLPTLTEIQSAGLSGL